MPTKTHDAIGYGGHGGHGGHSWQGMVVTVVVVVAVVMVVVLVFIVDRLITERSRMTTSDWITTETTGTNHQPIADGLANGEGQRVRYGARFVQPCIIFARTAWGATF